jgi:pimeloyl-ACP methyl ester carboxylesterase
MLSAFAGGRLFGQRTGSGEPRVLALHGWRGSHHQMAKVIDGSSAIALDLPGFGSSPEPDAVWGAADYADFIGPVLDQFERPPVVVGYSFGGRVAVNLAAAHPDRVAGLVLTGVPLVRRRPTRKSPLAFRIAKRLNKLGVLSDERMEAERRKRGSADYRSAQGLMRDVFVKLVNESYDQQLAEIACPVELVWGDVDTEAPLQNAEDASQILRDARLTVVPGATHWSIIDADAGAVRDAITRLERAIA